MLSSPGKYSYSAGSEMAVLGCGVTADPPEVEFVGWVAPSWDGGGVGVSAMALSWGRASMTVVLDAGAEVIDVEVTVDSIRGRKASGRGASAVRRAWAAAWSTSVDQAGWEAIDGPRSRVMARRTIQSWARCSGRGLTRLRAFPNSGRTDEGRDACGGEACRRPLVSIKG